MRCISPSSPWCNGVWCRDPRWLDELLAWACTTVAAIAPWSSSTSAAGICLPEPRQQVCPLNICQSFTMLWGPPGSSGNPLPHELRSRLNSHPSMRICLSLAARAPPAGLLHQGLAQEVSGTPVSLAVQQTGAVVPSRGSMPARSVSRIAASSAGPAKMKMAGRAMVQLQ